MQRTSNRIPLYCCVVLLLLLSKVITFLFSLALYLLRLSTMANTGINVADDLISQFNDFKLGRISPKPKYLIYHIAGDEVVVEHVGADEGDNSFAAFVALLPENDCRFAVYDMAFETNDGRPANKLVLVAWSPDTAKIKAKMVYSGTKDAVKRALQGIGTHVTATDLSELTEEEVVRACKQFS